MVASANETRMHAAHWQPLLHESAMADFSIHNTFSAACEAHTRAHSHTHSRVWSPDNVLVQRACILRCSNRRWIQCMDLEIIQHSDCTKTPESIHENPNICSGKDAAKLNGIKWNSLTEILTRILFSIFFFISNESNSWITGCWYSSRLLNSE